MSIRDPEPDDEAMAEADEANGEGRSDDDVDDADARFGKDERPG